MFSISIGILGFILYFSLLFVRYRTSWDVNEPGFSKFLHHFAIGVFWISFSIVAIGRVFPEFDLENLINGVKQPPSHIVLLENNLESDFNFLILEGNDNETWKVSYPQSGDGIKGVQQLESGKRNTYLLLADSSIVKYAIKGIGVDGEIADSLSNQVAFNSYPYRKHYIFSSEIIQSQTKKLSLNLIEEYGLLLMAVAGFLGFVYHGLRKRRNIWIIMGMIAGLLPVLLYCSNTIFYQSQVIFSAWE